MLDGAPQLAADMREKLENCFRLGLDRGNPPILEEFIAQVETRLHSGRDLNDALDWEPGPARTPAILKEFLETHTALHELTSGPPSRWNISEADEEVKRVLEAWGRIASSRMLNTDAIQTVVSFVGFQAGAECKQLFRSADILISSLPVSANSDDARPFASFGSALKSPLVVAIVWNEKSPQAVLRALREQNVHLVPAVVFYIGSLTTASRRLWAPLESGTQHLPIAVLDHVLLAHLCGLPAPRLKTFLHCALPFAALDPYNYYGFVPPEMFFGREDLANQLATPNGPSIIYGGRQLGKSALLDHVQRRFDKRDLGRYAWILPIRDVFLAQPPEYIWQLVRDSLVERKLLPNKPTVTPEATIAAIKDRTSAECSILLMIDEADSFLEADSRHGFREVNRFAALMLETAKRFRVIFAGTNSVMRYQSLPNHPLVQYGDPICLGPLEPSPARRLVREPLEALGFKLTDVDAMQVLSYTNYHPGLIQLFCNKLLEHVYSRRTPPSVPYELSSDEIESAKLAVREVMRDRFNLTLGVDKNNYYRVIACTVILDQLANTESTARLYSPRALLAMARQSWPAAFDSMSEETFRAKLAEMVGMGVLSQTIEGDLRLRSPRVVPLMGTPQSIREDLEEIAGKPAPAEFDTDSYHVLLGGQLPRYSPFTFAQESALNRNSVGLVFASDGCGLNDVEAALQRFRSFGAQSSVSVFEIVPQKLDSVEQWLASRWPAIEKSERIVLFHRLPAVDGVRLVERITSGLSFVQKHQASNRSTRLICVLDANATWNWCNLDEKKRTDVEKKLAFAAIRPWSRAGIRQRLDAADIAVSDDTLTAVYDVTGGWHMLLDELLKTSKPTTDLAGEAERFRAHVSNRDSELRRRFVASFGFDAHPELLAISALLIPAR